MLGEFFAALPDEIDHEVIEEGPWERFRTIEAKTVDPVSIATLGEIVGAGSYDDLVGQASEGPGAESEEAGVLTVPTSIRDALAARPLDVGSVAERWGRTDELAEWSPEDVRDLVDKLAELAQEAVETDRQLWFWWSL